jgi:hypothetical protein
MIDCSEKSMGTTIELPALLISSTFVVEQK